MQKRHWHSNPLENSIDWTITCTQIIFIHFMYTQTTNWNLGSNHRYVSASLKFIRYQESKRIVRYCSNDRKNLILKVSHFIIILWILKKSLTTHWWSNYYHVDFIMFQIWSFLRKLTAFFTNLANFSSDFKYVYFLPFHEKVLLRVPNLPFSFSFIYLFLYLQF